MNAAFVHHFLVKKFSLQKLSGTAWLLPFIDHLETLKRGFLLHHSPKKLSSFQKCLSSIEFICSNKKSYFAEKMKHKWEILELRIICHSTPLLFLSTTTERSECSGVGLISVPTPRKLITSALWCCFLSVAATIFHFYIPTFVVVLDSDFSLLSQIGKRVGELIKCLRLAKNIGKDRRVQKIDGSRQLVMRLRCIKKIGFQSERSREEEEALLQYINKEALEATREKGLLKEKAANSSSSKIDIISFPLFAEQQTKSRVVSESVESKASLRVLHIQ